MLLRGLHGFVDHLWSELSGATDWLRSRLLCQQAAHGRQVTVDQASRFAWGFPLLKNHGPDKAFLVWGHPRGLLASLEEHACLDFGAELYNCCKYLEIDPINNSLQKAGTQGNPQLRAEPRTEGAKHVHCVADRWTDKRATQTDKRQTDGRPAGRTDGLQTDGQTDAWTDGRMDAGADRRMD